MIIYSVTVKIDESVKQDWLDYMQNEHIPDVMKSGCFTNHIFTRVVGTSEEKENSFNIQYFCNQMKDMHKYQVQFAPKLQKDHAEKFGEKALAFRTLLEEV
ncbi:MAG: DUF4286 family protein [Bacteroidia bacterium]